MEEPADIPTSEGVAGRDEHLSVESKTRVSSLKSEVCSIEATSKRPSHWAAREPHIEAFCADHGDER